MKNITLEELRSTEAYKNDGRVFPHPNEIINILEEAIYNCKHPVKLKSIVVDKEGGAKTEEGEEISTWGRGVIQYGIEVEDMEYMPVIGIIFSYDTSKQAIKVFRGINVFACTNYMISGADDIYERLFKKIKADNERDNKKFWQREIEDVIDNICDKFQEFVDETIEHYGKCKELIGRLKQSRYNYYNVDNIKEDENSIYDILKPNPIYDLIGEIYLNDVVCGTFDYSTFNEGCRLIFNDKFLHDNKGLYKFNRQNIDLWQLYNAFTQRITDGKVDIDVIPNKTLEITKVLEKYITVD